MMQGTTHKTVINPNPKIALPMMGIMKWALAWADQPYQLTRMDQIRNHIEQSIDLTIVPLG
jgi:hypothetical protein